MKIEFVIDRLVLEASHRTRSTPPRCALPSAQNSHDCCKAIRRGLHGSASAFAAGAALPATETANAHTLGAGVARSLHGVLSGAPVAATRSAAGRSKPR